MPPPIEINENIDSRTRALITSAVLLPAAIGLIYLGTGGHVENWTVDLIPLPIVIDLIFVLWFFVVLKLVAIKLSTGKLVRQGPECVIVIDDEGVLDKRLKVGKILWTDVRNVYRVNSHNIPFICIETRRDDFYIDRVPGITAFFMRLSGKMKGIAGFSAITISAVHLDHDPDHLMALLEDRYRTVIRG